MYTRTVLIDFSLSGLRLDPIFDNPIVYRNRQSDIRYSDGPIAE
jgi:hypothetical protein